MAPRANWKGYLKIADLRCQIALYTAVSTAERVRFHTLNRATGHRVQRQFVDSETGRPVTGDDQVKGYDLGDNDFVIFEPDEIAAAIPDSDKTLAIDAFIPCDGIDTLYFDRPYYLAPANKDAMEAFTLVQQGMKTAAVAAIARTVIFRRLHTFLIHAHDTGLTATMLNYDYEMRASSEAFDDIPVTKIKGEMLDLAKHIIKTKQGHFDPKAFDDKYESALADLVKAKLEGKPIKKRKTAPSGKVVDLMDALRQSAGGSKPATAKARKKAASSKKPAAKKAASHRKAS